MIASSHIQGRGELDKLVNPFLLALLCNAVAFLVSYAKNGVYQLYGSATRENADLSISVFEGQKIVVQITCSEIDIMAKQPLQA